MSFLLLFSFLSYLVNHHLDSYRSFVVVNRSTEILNNDNQLRRTFLSIHLSSDPRRRITVHYGKGSHLDVEAEAMTSGSSANSIVSHNRTELIEEQTRDSFHWLNKTIAFLWPYLSHLVHFELNQFFRDQIESGSLGRSNVGSKRLYYAILRQLNTNVLAIERCQLGEQSPFIKNLVAFEGNAITKARLSDRKTSIQFSIGTESSKTIKTSPPIASASTEPSPANKDKTLVYNIDLAYNGDMDISVIYKYLCCCNSRMGFKDVCLHFNLQIVLGPIRRDIPFIDQVSFTLLEKPEFGYKGIALVELAELKLVRGVINKLITKYLLYPRVVTVKLSAILDKLINGPRAGDSPHEKETLGTGEPNLPISTRFTARTLLFICCCSNFCLRCCQNKRAKVDEAHHDTDEVHSNHTDYSNRPRKRRVSNVVG